MTVQKQSQWINVLARRESANPSRDLTLAICYEPISRLRLDSQNPRLHSRKQVRQIANSIASFGFNVPLAGLRWRRRAARREWTKFCAGGRGTEHPVLTSPPYDVGYGSRRSRPASAKASRATPRDAARAAGTSRTATCRPVIAFTVRSVYRSFSMRRSSWVRIATTLSGRGPTARRG